MSEAMADAGMRFMTWAECARICKGDVRPDLLVLRFEWASNGHHVVPRFQASAALPNLREVHARISSFSDGPLRLFDVLRLSHQDFRTLTLIARADLAGLRQVRFEIDSCLDGVTQVRFERLSPAVRQDDVADLAKGFGLWRYLLHA